MSQTDPKITVFIVTYRRHWMLKRAIASVLAQTYRTIDVWVLNDDPDDPEVASIVSAAADERIKLFEPVQRRGATGNFNLLFSEPGLEYVTLLEDDNWWEPTFLRAMMSALLSSSSDLVVGNERLWRELPGNAFEDTGNTLVDFRDVRATEFTLEQICGSARLCNSAMLVRRRPGRDFTTPATIPVDVTEHFRERLFDKTFPLVGEPLVNYTDTLKTARATRGHQWADYQSALIGSVFVAAETVDARCALAKRLWADCPSPLSPRAVTLVAAGLAIREARALLRAAPAAAIARFALTLLKQPSRVRAIASVGSRLVSEIAFLSRAPLTRQLVAPLRTGAGA